MKSLLWVLVFVLLSGTSAFADGMRTQANSKPLSDFELGKYQYCGVDSDCVATNNGCCDCANGGADVAVNKSQLERFQSRFECLHVACTERAAVPPCGSGVVSCVNHTCRYFPASAFELPSKNR